ncbi:uncharacterized protein LOC122732572 [Dromiciops gliroides]|uniref:uncharacterized protein LOC122732572 n=1 Tax=Dromiciops gliroides TaxID=33562 RepID=UPI001CC7258A|nr:uncharacterized protein LOC122732572 [Dromiciops gliroides]
MARDCLWLLLALVLPTVSQGIPCLEASSPFLPPEKGKTQPPLPKVSACMVRCATQVLPSLGAGLVSVLFNEAQEAEEQKYCWLQRRRDCKTRERLTRVFVLLDLKGPSAPPYELLPTTPALSPPSRRLRPRKNDPTLLSLSSCGLLYDVTRPFRSARRDGQSKEAEFCVKAVCPASQPSCQPLQGALSCPPFLATLWGSRPSTRDSFSIQANPSLPGQV